MTSLFANVDSETFEFEISLHDESKDSFIYVVQVRGRTLFVEVRTPVDGVSLVDACLKAWQDEVVVEHSRRVRDEIDGGVI